MTPPPKSPWSTWWPVGLAGALILLVLARVVTWHWVASQPELYLTPRGERLTHAGLIALPVLPVVVLLALAVARQVTKALAVSLVLLALLGGGASVAFGYATFELFEPVHRRTVVSPDGTAEAHVYEGGLLGCEPYLFVSERGAAVGRKVDQRSVACGAALDVAWRDGGAELMLP